jgi:Carboxypeptidase regulatory-like domain
MRNLRYVCLLIVLFAISPRVNGRPALGILAGTVVNSEGTPVANASVTVQTSEGLHPHAALTDATGHFRFVRGQYDLRASARGAYSDWSKRILVRSGKTTEVVLRLTR